MNGLSHGNTVEESRNGRGSSIAFADELRNSRVGLCQRRFIWKEHDAEMLRAWFLAEAGTVHDHDMFLADEFFNEDLVAFGDIDFGVSVKSAARGNATHARCRFTPLLREIAAGAQFALHF